jgi:hypothetical protein
MMIMGTMTRDIEKVKSCSVLAGLPEPHRSFYLQRFIDWAGTPVPLISPPVRRPTNKEEYPPCQSTWFWQADPEWVLQNAQNSAEVFFCEHFLDWDKKDGPLESGN